MSVGLSARRAAAANMSVGLSARRAAAANMSVGLSARRAAAANMSVGLSARRAAAANMKRRPVRPKGGGSEQVLHGRIPKSSTPGSVVSHYRTAEEALLEEARALDGAGNLATRD